MLQYKNTDETVTIVLTPQEVASLEILMEAASLVASLGIMRLLDGEIALAEQLAVLLYHFPDERIIDLLVEPHLSHEGDDIDEMRRRWSIKVPETRARYAGLGLIAG